MIRFQKVNNGFLIQSPTGPNGEWVAHSFTIYDIDQFAKARNHIESIYEEVAQRVLDDAYQRLDRLERGEDPNT